MVASEVPIIVVIPARGGSKGIPRKNVMMLAGKPLIAWTLEAAFRSASVSDVVISTDDAEIAQVGSRYGAKVVNRPPELSGDSASSETAVLHALDEYVAETGVEPPIVVLMQCTSPIQDVGALDRAIQRVKEGRADSVFSATSFHGFVWTQRGESLEGVNHSAGERLMRQNRPPEYLETGAFYVMSTDGFRASKHRFFGRVAVELVQKEDCVEIDDAADVVIAERVLMQAGDGETVSGDQ